MDNKAKNQALQEIKDSQNVLVTVSDDPSVDQLAAAIGLTLLLNKQGKHATAVFSGEVPSTLEFLEPEETFEENTDSLRDFIISLDKAKADKLRYKVEDDVVKIFITPYRTNITDQDLIYSQGDFNVDIVIALGVSQRGQIDAAIKAHGRILHDASVVGLMAGEEDLDLNGINWKDVKASSLCEMVADLSDKLKADTVDGQIATALLTGIVAETERFSNEKTSPKVMNISAKLMQLGANQQLIVEELDQNEEVIVEDEVNEEKIEEQNEKPEEEVVEDQKDVTTGSDGTLSIKHDPNEKRPSKKIQESQQATQAAGTLDNPVDIKEAVDSVQKNAQNQTDSLDDLINKLPDDDENTQNEKENINKDNNKKHENDNNNAQKLDQNGTLPAVNEAKQAPNAEPTLPKIKQEHSRSDFLDTPLPKVGRRPDSRHDEFSRFMTEPPLSGGPLNSLDENAPKQTQTVEPDLENNETKKPNIPTAGPVVNNAPPVPKRPERSAPTSQQPFTPPRNENSPTAPRGVAITSHNTSTESPLLSTQHDVQPSRAVEVPSTESHALKSDGITNPNKHLGPEFEPKDTLENIEDSVKRFDSSSPKNNTQAQELDSRALDEKNAKKSVDQALADGEYDEYHPKPLESVGADFLPLDSDPSSSKNFNDTKNLQLSKDSGEDVNSGQTEISHTDDEHRVSVGPDGRLIHYGKGSQDFNDDQISPPPLPPPIIPPVQT